MKQLWTDLGGREEKNGHAATRRRDIRGRGREDRTWAANIAMLPRLLKSHLAVDMHCDLAQREIGSYVNKDPKWAANIATWTIIEKSLSCRYTL